MTRSLRSAYDETLPRQRLRKRRQGNASFRLGYGNAIRSKGYLPKFVAPQGDGKCPIDSIMRSRRQPAQIGARATVLLRRPAISRPTPVQRNQSGSERTCFSNSGANPSDTTDARIVKKDRAIFVRRQNVMPQRALTDSEVSFSLTSH